jgi:hypothetical protein
MVFRRVAPEQPLDDWDVQCGIQGQSRSTQFQQ